MNSYPLAKVKFLKLKQAGAFNAANWNKPKQTKSGLKLRGRASEAYQRNAEDLLRILEAELKHFDMIFTHNPWGEYGHEEHVQVFRVLSNLRARLGFKLYVDTYVSDKSAPLMVQSLHVLADEPPVSPTNRTMARSLKDLYVRHNCWTFDADFEWPAYEMFYRVFPERNRSETTSPSTSLLINYLTRSRRSPGPIKNVARKLLPVRLRAQIRTRTRRAE